MSDSTKLMYHRGWLESYFDHNLHVPPIHIDMGIAKFCNIACVFCYGKYQELAPVYIKREPLIQTILDANEIGVKSIAFIGDGEPTCNPHLWEALAIAREKTHLDLAISTNGLMVNTRDKAEAILSACTWMRFCISAGTREGYQKIHGRDFFDRVVANIRQLVDVKAYYGLSCDVGMQSVYIPGTMDADMIAEAKLAVDLGVNYFVIKQCSLPDKGESGMEYFDVNAYDAPSTIDCLKQCEAMSTRATKIIVKWNTIKQKGQRPYKGCPSIPFISEISGNGDWFPCGHFFGNKKRFAQYKFGNVHEARLKDMFESRRYWDILKAMREDFDSHTQCKGACRQDAANKFCYDYLQAGHKYNWPDSVPSDLKGVNFI
ncbi:MAG: radical SAM protein [Patescibacteria group bacterium]